MTNCKEGLQIDR